MLQVCTHQNRPFVLLPVLTDKPKEGSRKPKKMPPQITGPKMVERRHKYSPPLSSKNLRSKNNIVKILRLTKKGQAFLLQMNAIAVEIDQFIQELTTKQVLMTTMYPGKPRNSQSCQTGQEKPKNVPKTIPKSKSTTQAPPIIFRLIAIAFLLTEATPLI